MAFGMTRRSIKVGLAIGSLALAISTAACQPVTGGPIPVALVASLPKTARLTSLPPTQCTAGINVVINGGSDFASNVYMLTKFDFAGNGGSGSYGTGSYKSPMRGASLGSLTDATSTMYKTDMAAAFNAAPPYLQAALCNLENQNSGPGVFIDGTGTSSTSAPFAWSFWEVGAQGNGRYIAITTKAWGQHAVVSNLQDLETYILGRLLGPDIHNTYYGPVTPSFATQTPESPGSVQQQSPTNIALMAMLAREVGFILYHDFVDPDALLSLGISSNICTDASGNPQKFQDFSWLLTGQQPSNLHQILALGPSETDPHQLNLSGPYVRPSTLRAAIMGSKSTTIVDDGLAADYDGQNSKPEFAGLLALTTPFNDFVETFRLQALKDAGVTAIALTLPHTTSATSPVNAMAGFNAAGSPLNQKAACLLNHLSVNSAWLMAPN